MKTLLFMATKTVVAEWNLLQANTTAYTTRDASCSFFSPYFLKSVTFSNLAEVLELLSLILDQKKSFQTPSSARKRPVLALKVKLAESNVIPFDHQLWLFSNKNNSHDSSLLHHA